jgi:hypothetical protein
MADSQVPWGVEALGGTITEPAWRSKPSWYLVTTDDQMIPAPAQREMSARAGSTVVEIAASHSVYVSQPAAVATLIEKAASEARSAVHWAAYPEQGRARRSYRIGAALSRQRLASADELRALPSPPTAADLLVLVDCVIAFTRAGIAGST